jgi:DNA-binding SARP family transcriptional activator/tetratricopeptide (TPR) repeat protein
VVLELRVLGTLAAERDGAEVVPRGSAAVRALLGVLIAAEGTALSTQQLAELAWGAERAADGVRPGSVHVGVSRLRRWLDLAAPEIGGDAVEHGPDGYRLRVPADAVDLTRYRRLSAAAARATDDAERLCHLRAAADLCRGPVLAGLDRVHREHPLLAPIDDLVRRDVLELADLALATGSPAEALPALERQARDGPLDEPVYARLVTVLAACGRGAEALRRYERVRARLAEEFGVGPGEQLRRAHAALLRADRPPAPSIRPGLLPTGAPHFTGREPSLHRLLEVLSHARAVGAAVPTATVTGPAGVGKTALALEAAHRARTRFPDGQLYAELRGARSRPTDPGEVLSRFLRALGVGGQGLPADVDERAELFRSLLAERRVLVVLDDAGHEEQVRPLLPGGPGCAVLVTSRRRLPGLGGWGVDLDVLDEDTAVRLLGRVAGTERVAAEPAAAERVVTLCGRVPLAVMIAASRLARLPHRRVDWLAGRLADDRRRLDELRLDDLEVRASLGSSYAALSDDARRLFRRLGLLGVPDAPAWAAARLLGAGLARAEESLDELVDAYLVDVAGMDAAGQTRYRLHDLVRLYARERAEVEEPAQARSEAVRDALAGWYHGVVAVTRQLRHVFPRPPRWPGDAEAVEPVAARAGPPERWLEAELTALVATVRQAAEAGADELCWRLAAHLDEYLESAGAYDEWGAVHHVALGAARRSGNAWGEARIRYGLGELAADRDRYTEASEHYRAAAQGFATVGDPLATAHVRRAAGVTARMLGRMDDARADLDAAAAVFAAHGDRAGLAAAAHGLGALHREQGRLAEARACYETAEAAFGEVGDQFSVAVVLCSLGNVHRLEGSPEAAADCLGRSLDLSRRLGYRPIEMFALCYLGEVHTEREEQAMARDLLDAARAISEEIGEEFGLALTLRALGDLQRRTGDHAAALGTLGEALVHWERLEAPIWRARTLDAIGAVHEAAGRTDDARAAWSEALRLFRSLDAPEAATVAERLAEGAE